MLVSRSISDVVLDVICLSLDYLDIFWIVLSLDFLRQLPEFHCSSSCAKSKKH